MATRDELTVRRDAAVLRLEQAVERVASGDRSTQYNLTILERAVARLDDEIAAIDALAVPVIRQVRVYSTRGY